MCRKFAVMTEKEEKKDPFDGEYIGNPWGWRFSFIGLGLILLMLGLMVYRHYALGVPFGGEPQSQESGAELPDTLSQPDTLR